MELRKEIINSTIYDLEILYDRIFTRNKNEKEQLLKELFLKAFDLEACKFLSEKLENFFSIQCTIEKINNKLFSILLYSNIKEKKYEKNIELWKKFQNKIKFEFERKAEILNFVAFSLIENKHYEDALILLEEIKNFDNKFKENYIDCLNKTNNHKIALIELKKYFPKMSRNLVWKEMNLANTYYKLNDSINLIKHSKKAEKLFRLHRIDDKEMLSSTYFYYLGKFSEKLNKNSDAIFYYECSLEHQGNAIIELIYKEKAKLNLNRLGVKS